MITDWIYSEEFTSLEKGFLKWLETLNYSPATIATRRRNIREFLLYLERCGINNIADASQYKVSRYVRYLKRRGNRLYGSGLMNASVNVGISTVNKFFEYLTQSGISHVPDKLAYLNGNYKPIQILTLKDIDRLYAATYIKNPKVKPKNKTDGRGCTDAGSGHAGSILRLWTKKKRGNRVKGGRYPDRAKDRVCTGRKGQQTKKRSGNR